MKKHGFTLAEVLITLVIIGVIAAMTIPTLMGSTNEQEKRSAFKKAISAVNQAVALEKALYGNTHYVWHNGWFLADGLKNHMSVIEDNGSRWKTADGLIYDVRNLGGEGCTVYVDINGDKGNGDDDVDVFGIVFNTIDDGACELTGVPATEAGSALLYN